MFEWNMSSKTCASNVFWKKKHSPINSFSRLKPHETPNPLTFPSLAEGTTKVAFWTLTSLGFMFFQIPSTRCHIEIQLLPKIKGLQMWCDQQECQVWRAIPISFLFERNKKVAKSKPNKEICDLFGVQMFNETYSSNKNHLHPKHAIFIPFRKLNRPDRSPKNYPDRSVVLHYPRSIYPQLNVVGTQPQTQKTWVSFRDRWKYQGPTGHRLRKVVCWT